MATRQITTFLVADPDTGETWESLEVHDENGQLISTTFE